mmetsp:Transcript_4037/g.5139  ORF Transcript_4037/g.5139 Transcript_4037/m.5139 type:complete len:117 (-) Transcript_4037:343-693(-)
MLKPAPMHKPASSAKAPNKAAAMPAGAMQQKAPKVPTLPKFTPQDQNVELKNLLRALVAENPFNAYCVDCLKNQACYFELNYAIFICEPCASIHYSTAKVGKRYLKQIYTEQWDPT